MYRSIYHLFYLMGMEEWNTESSQSGIYLHAVVFKNKCANGLKGIQGFFNVGVVVGGGRD